MMDRVVVHTDGIVSGQVEVLGFKHAFVSVVSACLAARGKLVLINVPDILEVQVFSRLLKKLNCDVTLSAQRFEVDCTNVNSMPLDPELSSSIHGAMYLVPALAAATGHASLVQSGGCAIGDDTGGLRPTSHFVDVMQAFGLHAQNDQLGGLEVLTSACKPTRIDIQSFSERSDVLTGPRISGATKAALICAASTAAGTTSVVKNPYPKPDVTDVLRYLDLAGFAVAYDGTEVVLTPGAETEPVEMALTPDLSEIITYVTLSVMTGASVALVASGMSRAYDGLLPERQFLTQMGITLICDGDQMQVELPEQITAVDIDVTSVGIYSDHQPFFALMLSKAAVPVVIREYVWKKRFSYTTALRAFGLRLVDINSGVRISPSELTTPKDTLYADDLRMAAVLLVASLCVPGPVKLGNMSHLERGYSKIWDNLTRLGAQFTSQPNAEAMDDLLTPTLAIP